MFEENTENANALDAFIGDGFISEVLYQVRSGKEATVYCCRGGEVAGKELLAAKVYRPLEQSRISQRCDLPDRPRRRDE